MVLMRAFSNADTSAVDCLSEMLSSACAMSAVSVVLLFSLLVSSCHALVTWIRRMRARTGESAARAGGTTASPPAAAAEAASAAASEGVSWPPLGFYEDEEACCWDIWEGKASVRLLPAVTLSSCSTNANARRQRQVAQQSAFETTRFVCEDSVRR